MKLPLIPSRAVPRHVISLGAVLSVSVAVPGAAQTLTTAGWVEYASVHPGGLVYSAKLDSGARHTSIHATGIKHFRKGDADWVSFRLKADDGTVRAYELPVVRSSKTRDMTGPSIVRPVVRLSICVGDRLAAVDVNLSNRRGFNHGLLIGRSYLRTRYLIHSGERHLHKLNCPEPAPTAQNSGSATTDAERK